MVLPTVLLAIAAVCSAVVAYGTHPSWAQYEHGLGLILFARQFQWPLATVSLLLCLSVIALVVSGKRRAWWLIGLGPVLALFVHRFHNDPLRNFLIADDPAFVPAEQAAFMGDEDYVVGSVIDGTAYAYPYASLYPTPVVVHADHDKRVVVIFSAFANRAVAYSLDRDVRARDFEIVSMPANALLVYNTKFGQFINGVTGRTPKGEKPTGFGQGVVVQKMAWKEWRRAHPSTRVLAPAVGTGLKTTMKGPVKPVFPMRSVGGDVPEEARVVLIGTDPPAAILAEDLTTAPLNLTAGEQSLLVFREKGTGRVRAFERRIDDLRPRFVINTDPKRGQAWLVDSDTNSGWNAGGKAVDGHASRENRQLAGLPVDEGLYWSVVGYWFPGVSLLTPPPVTAPTTLPQVREAERPTGVQRSTGTQRQRR